MLNALKTVGISAKRIALFPRVQYDFTTLRKSPKAKFWKYVFVSIQFCERDVQKLVQQYQM